MEKQAVSLVSLDVVEALKDASIVFILALLLFGPVTGLVLDYSYQGGEMQLLVNQFLSRPLILALVVACGRFVFSLLFQVIQQTPSLSRLLPRKSAQIYVVKENVKQQRLALLAFLLVGLLTPLLLPAYLPVIILALIYVLLGLGLNIVVGLAGLLDLGFVAFYAVGAYGYGLGHEYLGLSFWAALPLGALMAACFGAVLGFPVLRMHGDYLAIVTLGFGEIIRLVLNNWTEFTHGPNGVSSIPPPTLFGLEFSRVAKQGGTPFHEYFGLEFSRSYKLIFIYLTLFVLVVMMTWFVMRLRNMPIGRAWEALREDEIACRSLGINHVSVKLSAFSMGAMVGGIAGVFFAAKQGAIDPASFNFFESALILAIVVLGGLGSTVGVICAALVLTILPYVLREIPDMGSYRVLIFGLFMVLMMVWRPRGLLPIRRKFYPETGATA